MIKRNLVICILLASFFTCNAQQQTGVKDVIVVFKTHFDIGYTDWAGNIRHKYANEMIEGALSIIEQSKQMPKDQQFKWIVAGWPMHEMLARCKPGVKPLIEDAIRNGSFSVHALPFTFETEACNPESVVRSLSYSSAINRQAGLPQAIDAKLTDVPSHSWSLPTILSNAGIRFLHIGCNPASQSPDLPLLFWWEGPDKSRLMTMYFGPYYGTTPSPPEGWPYKTWLAIIHTNDNTGAPSYEEFVSAIHEIEKKNPGARVRTGSMADFYNALMAENPDLPVVRGDMPDTWIHGYMSMPREVKEARSVTSNLFSLEKLNTSLTHWGLSPDEDVAEVSTAALEQIHLFDEHTFGLAMSHGNSGYWAYGNDFESLRAQGIFDPIEFSWQEKGLHVSNARQMVLPAMSRIMAKLARSVDVSGDRIVVYNPLPWERSGMVRIQSWMNLKNAVKNVVTGEVIPVAKDRNIVRFLAKNIPSMGYATFVPVYSAVDFSNQLIADTINFILENQFVRLKIDPATGTISSFTDKNSGRELVNHKSEWKAGQYVNERFSKTMTDSYADTYIKNKESTWHWAYQELGRINLDNSPYQRISGKQPEIKIKQDPISVSVQMNFAPDAINKHSYTEIITLYNNQPYAELIWSINGKPADAWPEAGWITFPLNISSPSFRLGRNGAVVNPATDYIRGSNHDYCFLYSGMAVIDEHNNGLGLMSPDVPAVSLDRPGLWKYTPDFVPRQANVFFNLYNNQWSTNFTEWVEGSWSTRFYLWPVSGYSNEKSVISPSEEFNNPLIAGIASGTAGPLSAENTGIKLSRKGVNVTTFMTDAESKGTLLRIWEETGVSGKLDVKLPVNAGFRNALPVDLRGKISGEKIPVTQGIFSFDLKAYSPASFILQ